MIRLKLAFISVILLLSAGSLIGINAQPVGSKKNIDIVFVGNSITYGVMLKHRETEAPPAVASEFLRKQAGIGTVEFINHGRSGFTTVDYLPSGKIFKEVVDATRQFHQDNSRLLIFSISLGTNDSAEKGPNGSPVSPAAFHRNLKAIADSLMAIFPDCRIIFQQPIWYSPNTRNGAVYVAAGLTRLQTYFPEFESVIMEYAESTPGRVFVGNKEGFDYFKDHYQTDLIPEKGELGTFYLHPNEKGAAVLGNFWGNAIYKMLEQRSRAKIETPTIVGTWQHIFNPNDTRSQIDTTWYTNDHCFSFGSDGKWHAYGIIGHKPIDPWTGETKFFHITADQFNQSKWKDEGYALEVKPGVERVLWAPHVLHEKGSDTWHMFYNIGNMQQNANTYASWGQLCRADSKDMYHWERHVFNPLFSDAGHARDSYVIKIKNTYYFYYTRTYSETDLRSCVAVRTSTDLNRWSGAKIVHIQPYKVMWGGDAESPFVVERSGIFYLFTCRAMTNYNQTHVYWSTDPMNFPIENFVCELPTHASEIIKVSDSEWYISNTGWDKKGLYIAQLEWRK